MRKKCNISDIPESEFCGIYALVDTKGKPYIGSSKNIRRRVLQHNTYMNACLRTGHSGFLNQNIETALLNGECFSCKILATFSCNMSSNELREIERVFIGKFGGCGETYNVSPISHKI